MALVRWVENHMNSCLIMGCLLGLIWPYWSWVPDKTVLALIMGATFIACFRLNTREFARVPWRLVSGFYVFRFIIIPVAVYYLSTLLFSPEIAIGLLLIAALPVGASAPAIAHVFGGQVALTAILTLLSTLLAPFLLPVLTAYVSGASATPSPEMFRTLLVSLLLPCLLFVYVRRYPVCYRITNQYGRAATILMISAMISIVVGKLRLEIFAAPLFVFHMAVLAFALLALLLALGWWAGARLPQDQRIGLATASGFNNIGLGVGLAMLHFSPTVGLVAIATEIAWAFLPVVMRFLNR